MRHTRAKRTRNNSEMHSRRSSARRNRNKSSNNSIPQNDNQRTSRRALSPNQRRSRGNTNQRNRNSQRRKRSNQHPPFYAVEATLIGERRDDQFPEPSAPPLDHMVQPLDSVPVVNAVPVNNDFGNHNISGNTGGNGYATPPDICNNQIGNVCGNSNGDDPIIEHPQPDQDPTSSISCYRKHQTKILVGALILIAALVGSIVSIILIGNIGSDPPTTPTDALGNPPTVLRSPSPSPEAASISLATPQTMIPRPTAAESLGQGTVAASSESSDKITEIPTSPTLITSAWGNSPPGSIQYPSAASFTFTDSPNHDSVTSPSTNIQTAIAGVSYRGTPNPTDKPTLYSNFFQMISKEPTLHPILTKYDVVNQDQTGQIPPLFCNRDSDCASNSCAYDSYSTDASEVCCEGDYHSMFTFSTDGWPTTDIRKFCQDRPIGTLCGVTDAICASSACVEGACAEAKRSIGESCTFDNSCSTNKCGYNSYSTDASAVCCERDYYSMFTFSTDGWPTTDIRKFCQDRPIGTLCGVTDAICASSLCVEGACAESKQSIGESCILDNDCSNNKCGFDAFSSDASGVCCEGGYYSMFTFSTDGWPTSSFRHFCQDRPIGTLCGVTDAICASNACVNGVCAG